MFRNMTTWISGRRAKLAVIGMIASLLAVATNAAEDLNRYLKDGHPDVYTVVKGDTLWGLSRKYGVSQDSIRAANGMAAGDNNIRLGQSINIPAR